MSQSDKHVFALDPSLSFRIGSLYLCKSVSSMRAAMSTLTITVPTTLILDEQLN